MKGERLSKKKKKQQKKGEGGVQQFPVVACSSASLGLPLWVCFRVKSTDEAERNRMQAIKCVVVGDGYAIILLILTSVL